MISTSLSHLHFLKVSLHDIKKLSRSLAFENFCEIESDQLKIRRRHLGAACIMCGRVLAVNIPLLTIQSIFEPSITIRLFARQKLLFPADIYKIKSFQEKYVRILCVLWNTLGFNRIQYPELLGIETAFN